MARSRNLERLDELVEAAARVFSRKGYRRTQMADVARALGVAAGTLYGYVAGKEALFDLCLQRAFLEDPPPAPRELPVPRPAPGALVQHARERLARGGRMPALAQALRRGSVPDPAGELGALVGELYDFLRRNAGAIRLLERTAPERPELAAVYFGRARGGLLERWRRYLEARIGSGAFRPVPDLDTAARFLVEAVSWFAWHRHDDPAPHPYDDAIARETAVVFAVRTLAREETSP